MNAIRQILTFAVLLTTGVAHAETPTDTLAAEMRVEVEASGERAGRTPGRMALYESALMPAQGRGAWSTLNLGLQRFDYAVHDNVQLGVTTVLPLGILAVMPEVKVGGEIAEDLHIAVTGRFGAMVALGLRPVVGYGGSAMLTYGTPDLHLTAGLHAYGFNSVDGGDTAWMVHPTLGGVVRLARFAIAHLDVGPALSPSFADRGVCIGGSCGSGPAVPGDLWAIKYGVRFHGDHFFGDVSFVIPTHEDFFEKVAMFMPLGIPTLTFGYAF